MNVRTHPHILTTVPVTAPKIYSEKITVWWLEIQHLCIVLQTHVLCTRNSGVGARGGITRMAEYRHAGWTELHGDFQFATEPVWAQNPVSQPTKVHPPI